MWTRTTLNGKDVVVERDDYGDWLLVQNYEHYGGTNPTVDRGTKFPQMPNNWARVADVQNMGTNGELRHVDNINQFGTWNVDSVRLYGETSNHNRIIHFRTTDQTVIDSITADNVSPAYTDFQGSTTVKYSDHSANLPANAGGDTDARTDRLFGKGFPFYNGGSNHWAVKGSGTRWEVDDYPGDASQTTVHRVWVRLANGVNFDGTVMRTSDSLVRQSPVNDR